MENDSEFVSRTQKKHEVEELQKLGAALVELPLAHLETLALPALLFAAVAGNSAAARAQQMRLESWRERLIGDDTALTAYASEHPGADLQALRTLIRNARKEIAEGKPPRAQRELFRLIRDPNETG